MLPLLCSAERHEDLVECDAFVPAVGRGRRKTAAREERKAHELIAMGVAADKAHPPADGRLRLQFIGRGRGSHGCSGLFGFDGLLIVLSFGTVITGRSGSRAARCPRSRTVQLSAV